MTERFRAQGGAGPADPDVPDLAVLAQTDALLDRLGDRRPSAEDLDDPAVAALALLAKEIDLPDVPTLRLRRELTALGAWPPGADRPADDVVAHLAPEGPELDRYLPGPPRPYAGSTSETPPPGPGAGRDRTAPRQVRVRVLAVAVAACAAVGLYGLGGFVTGSWNPFEAGAIVAGQDDGGRIERLLTDGLQLVSATGASPADLSRGRENLVRANELVRDADLTAQERATIERLIDQLAAALQAKGVAVPPGLQTGTAVPTPDGTGTPTSLPTGGPTTGPVEATTATSSVTVTLPPPAASTTTPVATTTDEPSPTHPTGSPVRPPSTTTTTSPTPTTTTRTRPGKSPTKTPRTKAGPSGSGPAVNPAAAGAGSPSS